MRLGACRPCGAARAWFLGTAGFAGVAAVGSGARAQDPSDPLPPTNVAASSSYATPTSIRLTWTDPTTLVDGTVLSDFSIDLYRGEEFLANVDQGAGEFDDVDLVDGELYEYALRARDDATDSLSIDVPVSAFAGGSPVPAPPSNAGCAADSASISLSWTNPAAQSDGAPLDDFAGVRLFRGGTLLVELARAASDTGAADSYVDAAILPGIAYEYEVAAFDSEIPIRESARVPAGTCSAGSIPPILLWKPGDIVSSSPETMRNVFEELGETCWLTNDLFAFGPDLSVHEIVYAFAGIGPNNHLVSDPEGLALDAFTFGGGRLLLEGGDCLNYDPEIHDTYDLRPVFGLLDGPDGTSDVFHVLGRNDLEGYAFQYLGPNRFMDELAPATSIPILENAANADVCAVFHAHYGSGRSIAFTFEVGHLVDVPAAAPTNEKAALLADCLRLLRDTTPPVLLTGAAAIVDTLYSGDSTTTVFTISNPGSVNADLLFTIGEDPETHWISASPTSGALQGNESAAITTLLDARALPPGDYAANLVVAANDSANAADTVFVSLHVTPPPDLAVDPDSLGFAVLANGGTRVDSLSMTNTGAVDLVYYLEIDSGGADRFELSSEEGTFFGGNRYRGNVVRADSATEIRRIEHLAVVDFSTTIEFFVYEGLDSAGTFTKVHSSSIVSPIGPGWKSSEPMEVQIEPGRFYFIGAGWQGSMTYFSDAGQTPIPLALPFGELLGSAGSNTYPPPPSRVVSSGLTLISQAIEFGETADVVVLSPDAGTLPPSESAWVLLRATGHDLEGIFPATLNITSNDPTTFIETLREIPITVFVGTATGAPALAVSPPSRTALHPNAPNPFRAATSIRFDLPRDGRAALRISDLSGRLVRTLVEGDLGAGVRTVHWDGRDAGGLSVSSGVYFYSLETPTESMRRKALRLR